MSFVRILAFGLLFLLGAAPARAEGAAAPADSGVVPFEFVHEQQILFRVTVNGHPAEAWLDSGASATVVDAAFAKAIGAPPGIPARANGVAGAIGGVRLTTVRLAAGRATAEPQAVAVMDLSMVARAVDRPVQVILGRDLFDRAAVDIDFRTRRLRFVDRAAFRPPPQAPLPLTRSGDLRSIPIRVDGQPLAAVVDLGNAGALMLDREVAERQGLLTAGPRSTEIGVGADGARVNTVATVPELTVGEVAFHEVPASFVEHLSSKAPANIGLQVLSRFEVILDFHGDRLWLLPAADAARGGFRRNRAGLAVNRVGDRLVVVHVAPGGPGEAAGWKAGEAIVAVDGVTIGPDYAQSRAWGFTLRPAGTSVALTMADGSVRRLTLRDYY